MVHQRFIQVIRSLTRCKAPTYIINATGSGGSLNIELILALGEVEARITIFDQDGGNFTIMYTQPPMKMVCCLLYMVEWTC